MVDIIRVANTMQQVNEIVDGCNDVSRRNVLHRLINDCVRDDLNHSGLIIWREYIHALQRNTICIKHTIRNMVCLVIHVFF
ncbi:hypothetical protein D3C71_2118670 [compost metagenome]